jgi:hypothetical protein
MKLYFKSIEINNSVCDNCVFLVEQNPDRYGNMDFVCINADRIANKFFMVKPDLNDTSRCPWKSPITPEIKL